MNASPNPTGSAESSSPRPKNRKARKSREALLVSVLPLALGIYATGQFPYPISIVAGAALVLLFATFFTWFKSAYKKWSPSPRYQYALLVSAIAIAILAIAAITWLFGEQIDDSWAAATCALLYCSTLLLTVTRTVPFLTLPIKAARWSNRSVWSRAVLGAAGLAFAYTLVALALSRSVGGVAGFDGVLSLLSEAVGLMVLSVALFAGRDGTVAILSIAAGIVTVSLGAAFILSKLFFYGFGVIGFGLFLALLGPAIRSQRRSLITISSYAAAATTFALAISAHHIGLRLVGAGYMLVAIATLIFGIVHHGKGNDHLITINSPRRWPVRTLLASGAALAATAVGAFSYAVLLMNTVHIASSLVFVGVGLALLAVICGYSVGYARQQRINIRAAIGSVTVANAEATILLHGPGVPCLKPHQWRCEVCLFPGS